MAPHLDICFLALYFLFPCDSAGRAFGTSGPSASGFPFSLPSSYLSKPVQVARPVDSGYKTPKYIVYPSYTANSVPNYGGPVGMQSRHALQQTLARLECPNSFLRAASLRCFHCLFSFRNVTHSNGSVCSRGGIRWDHLQVEETEATRWWWRYESAWFGICILSIFSSIVLLYRPSLQDHLRRYRQLPSIVLLV